MGPIKVVKPKRNKATGRRLTPRELAETVKECTYLPGWKFRARVVDAGQHLLITVSYTLRLPAGKRSRFAQNYEMPLSKEVQRREIFRRIWSIIVEEEKNQRKQWLLYRGERLHA